MPGTEWQKVFKAAVAKAKDIRKKNPNLSYPQAMKQAWKSPEILKLKDDYQKKNGAPAKKKGSGTKGRGRPAGSRTKKAGRKPAARKVVKRKTTKRKTVRRVAKR